MGQTLSLLFPCAPRQLRLVRLHQMLCICDTPYMCRLAPESHSLEATIRPSTLPIIINIYFILFPIISYTVRPITYTDTVRPMCNLNRARLLLQCSMKNLFKPTYDDNGKDFDSSSHSMPYPPRHHRQSVCCEMHFPKTNTTTSPHFNSSKALFCHSELLASIDLEI